MIGKLKHWPKLWWCVLGFCLLCGAASAQYELTPLTEITLSPQRPIPDLSAYTVAAVRDRLPRQLNGQTASVQPMSRLYFIPDSNIYDMQRVWASQGIQQPECIVLGRGDYTLESVYQQINNPNVLAKESEHVYLLSRPLYIAPTASLILREGDWLKLSLSDGVFIIYNGRLYIVDSKVSSWDQSAGDYGQRDPLPKETVLMYRVQTPRPYLLGLEGSETYAANSEFIGLGYKGASGTFGLSFSSTVRNTGLGQYLKNLPRPQGWLVGNRIEDLYFGFYTTETSGAVIVGNEFYDNIVYGIDPHDYSDHLIIARNITHGSQFSHGIIASREVNNSWITQNLAFNNTGSGIMLDRMSSNNTVSDNLVFANQGDGIAVFESDNNRIQGNFIARNQRNGVYVRNSLAVDVVDNRIDHNGRNGVELAAVDINFLETRDFELDPYQQKASATLNQNYFKANFNSAVAGKSFTRLALFNNRYQASGPLYFSGDLETHAARLLHYELKQKTPVALISARTDESAPGLESEGTASTEARSIEALRRLAAQGIPRAMLALARWYETKQLDQSLYWYGRVVLHSRPSAFRGLGLLLLSRKTFTKQQRKEGLVLFTMAALLEDARAKLDLTLLPDILGIAPEDISQARNKALRRLRKAQFWNAELFPDIAIRLSGKERQTARKRARRLASAFGRAKPKRTDILAATGAREHGTYDQDDYVDSWREQSDNNKELRNLRIATRNRLNEHASGERRQYLDRVAERRQSAKTRLAELSESDRRDLLARFEVMLKRINYHRSPAAQIRINQLSVPLLSAD